MSPIALVWMIGIFSIGLLLVVISAQCYMRSNGNGVAFFRVLGALCGVCSGAWYGKAFVDATYLSATPPPEIWMGALWIGTSTMVGIVAGALILVLSAFPQKEG